MSVAAMPIPMMAAAANWITAFAMAATNSHHFDLTLDYPWGNTLYRLEEQYPAAATVTVGVCYVYIFSIPIYTNMNTTRRDGQRVVVVVVVAVVALVVIVFSRKSWE